jgi:hypothetical protein
MAKYFTQIPGITSQSVVMQALETMFARSVLATAPGGGNRSNFWKLRLF